MTALVANMGLARTLSNPASAFRPVRDAGLVGRVKDILIARPGPGTRPHRIIAEMTTLPEDALGKDLDQLGSLLDETIRRLAGEDTLNLAEDFQAAAQSLREAPSGSGAKGM